VGGAPPLKSTKLLGDLSFKPSNLNQSQLTWYNRLWESLDSELLLIKHRTGSGNLYYLGRQIDGYSTAALMGLRATGDLKFLDRALEVWDVGHAVLADALDCTPINCNKIAQTSQGLAPSSDPKQWCKCDASKCPKTKDGFLNWLYMDFFPKSTAIENPSYYCRDSHQMDETMTHSAVAHLAYALHANRSLAPKYAAAADKWRQYLETQFLAKWCSRGGGLLQGWKAVEKDLAHPVSRSMRMAYYLYAITGKPLYLDRAKYYAGVLQRHVVLKSSSYYVWDHRVTELNKNAAIGAQAINYAQYTVGCFVEMNTEGFAQYAGAGEMERYMRTFRDVVFKTSPPSYGSMSAAVDGSGSTSFSMYGLSALARWDTTGALLAAAEATYSKGQYETAAGALAAISTR
jgi:hypothetical protein